MAYKKCPACMLNYIPESEHLCPVCQKTRSGAARDEEDFELCQECGAEPAEPGEDFCAHCLELQIRQSGSNPKLESVSEDDDWTEDSRKERDDRMEVPLSDEEKDDDEDSDY